MLVCRRNGSPFLDWRPTGYTRDDDGFCMTADKGMAKKASSRAVFPAPGHDHERCSSDAIAHAEAICAARAERLTPIRRSVLEALLVEPSAARRLRVDRPPGGARRKAGADHDLSRARFPARTGPGAPDREPQRVHRLRAQSRQRRSGGVPDLRALRRRRRGGRPPPSPTPLKAASRAAGFTPKTPVIEIFGICVNCKAA